VLVIQRIDLLFIFSIRAYSNHFTNLVSKARDRNILYLA